MRRVFALLAVLALAGCGVGTVGHSTPTPLHAATPAAMPTIAPMVAQTATISPTIVAEMQTLDALHTRVAQDCGITTQQVGYDQATIGALLVKRGMSQQASEKIALGQALLRGVIQLRESTGMGCDAAFVAATNTLLTTDGVVTASPTVYPRTTQGSTRLPAEAVQPAASEMLECPGGLGSHPNGDVQGCVPASVALAAKSFQTDRDGDVLQQQLVLLNQIVAVCGPSSGSGMTNEQLGGAFRDLYVALAERGITGVPTMDLLVNGDLKGVLAMQRDHAKSCQGAFAYYAAYIQAGGQG